jgi:hypothetical protein
VRPPAAHPGEHELGERMHVPERCGCAAVHQQVQRTINVDVRELQRGGAYEEAGIVHQRDRCVAQATGELTPREEEVVLRYSKIVDEADAPARNDAVLVRHARPGEEAVQCDERDAYRPQPDKLRPDPQISRRHCRDSPQLGQSEFWRVWRLARKVASENAFAFKKISAILHFSDSEERDDSRDFRQRFVEIDTDMSTDALDTPGGGLISSNRSGCSRTCCHGRLFERASRW